MASDHSCQSITGSRRPEPRLNESVDIEKFGKLHVTEFNPITMELGGTVEIVAVSVMVLLETSNFFVFPRILLDFWPRSQIYDSGIHALQTCLQRHQRHNCMQMLYGEVKDGKCHSEFTHHQTGWDRPSIGKEWSAREPVILFLHLIFGPDHGSQSALNASECEIEN